MLLDCFSDISLHVCFSEQQSRLFVFESRELQPTIKYLSGMYCLVASLPLMFLANRAIKKDEKLVKSLDRLR